MFIPFLRALLSFSMLATSAAAQEREWTLDAAEEDVYMLFGVPNTTDVGVSFWCKINSREISIFAPLPTKTEAPATVSIVIDQSAHNLAVTPIEEPKSKTVEAKLLPQDRILEELQNAERFTFTVGAHKAVYPLEGADFAGLIKLCAARNQN